MARKDFVRVLREVAKRNHLDFRAMSHDWVIQIVDPAAAGRICNVFGYTFDINGAGAAEVCKEKAATSLVLGSHGVANVEHRVFLNPSNEFTAPYVPPEGNYTSMRALIETEFGGLPVVLKPLKGSGGLDVIRAASWKDVEAAVQLIFGREYGVAVSKFYDIRDEYRCVCLDDKVYVAYRKHRQRVVGDGERNVASLAARHIESAAPKDRPALYRALSEISADKLDYVPGAEEQVLLQWKHNLGQGATASILDRATEGPLVDALQVLALSAVQAVGMRFCSVDIIDVKGEGLMVMEINSGVMMDALITQLGDDGAALAYDVYESAVLRALARK
ncbi:hypothetical protein M885DRAFT_480893 [Pelagophyceae sp. CCMP2097]|nr:hypothetical protein M885DRAFT_480893 [Pelagophyceae sp. CCMP2097]